MPPVNEDDLDWEAVEQGESTFRQKKLGEAASGEKLGCSLYELPSGHKSWPYHYHAANEEAMYVLAGTGTLRLDGDTYPIEAGDYVSFPADETGGHKVINDSEDSLRYLMLSTMNETDVTFYPDSDKLGVYAGSPPGGSDEPIHQAYYEIDDDVDYWKGE